MGARGSGKQRGGRRRRERCAHQLAARLGEAEAGAAAAGLAGGNGGGFVMIAASSISLNGLLADGRDGQRGLRRRRAGGGVKLSADYFDGTGVIKSMGGRRRGTGGGGGAVAGFIAVAVAVPPATSLSVSGGTGMVNGVGGTSSSTSTFQVCWFCRG